MNEKDLNVVYIGRPTFPSGFATTKRRRYKVYYMDYQPNFLRKRYYL